MSWAVFEHKATGEKFAIINVHFDSFDEDTNNDGKNDRMVGAQKAQILVDYIIKYAQKLTAQYNCPMLIGGDMNSTANAEAFTKYSSAGYTHVRDLSEYKDEERGHFGIYPIYTETASDGFFTMSEDVDLSKADYKSSVDHIFVDVAGKAGIEFESFDVIADPSNASFGDHCGMVIDFKFK